MDEYVGRADPRTVAEVVRCERCLRLRDDPVHRPVAGASFFATLTPEEDQPWATQWLAPHPPFAPPPPTTSERLGAEIVALDLDLPPRPAAGVPAGWGPGDLEELGEGIARWFPAETPPASSPPRPATTRRPRLRVLLAVTLGVLLLASAAAASSQRDVSDAQDRLARLQQDRLVAAERLEETRAALAAAEVALRAGLATEDAARGKAAHARAAARRIAADTYLDATQARLVVDAAVAGGSVAEAQLAAAYVAATVSARVAADRSRTASAQTAAGRRRGAAARVAALRGDVRDLEFRLDEIDRSLLQARRDLVVVRRSAQDRLGIGDAAERWRPLVARYFPPEYVDDALWVLWCESRGDPEARAWPRSSAVGLFQFLDGTWEWLAPKAGVEGRDRTDPEANIRAAAWLLRFSIRTHHPDGPWGPWGCRA